MPHWGNGSQGCGHPNPHFLRANVLYLLRALPRIHHAVKQVWLPPPRFYPGSDDDLGFSYEEGGIPPLHALSCIRSPLIRHRQNTLLARDTTHSPRSWDYPGFITVYDCPTLLLKYSFSDDSPPPRSSRFRTDQLPFPMCVDLTFAYSRSAANHPDTTTRDGRHHLISQENLGWNLLCFSISRALLSFLHPHSIYFWLDLFITGFHPKSSRMVFFQIFAFYLSTNKSRKRSFKFGQRESAISILSTVPIQSVTDSPFSVASLILLSQKYFAFSFNLLICLAWSLYIYNF